MKKTISLIALTTLVTYAGYATVLTVSNSPLGGAQFSSLQAAYTACAATGDTLNIEGTDIVYFLSDGQRWEKSITVIGIGFNPQKQIPKRVKFRGADNTGFNFYLKPLASGSRFYGIEFIERVRLESGAVNDLLFENCYLAIDFLIGSGTSSNGFAFTNCVFYRDNDRNVYFEVNQVSSGTFNNCIFDGHIEGNGNPNLTLEFNHCLFLSNNTTGTQIFYNVYYAVIRNSIFNRFPTGTFFSSYINNLCRASGAFPPSPANGNTGSGNIEATDPLFVNSPINTLYGTTSDYHLLVGSQAIGSANDLTDIGVHGGFTGFSSQGEVLINPIIRAMNILNSTVASNGTLNVQIHATKPDND